MRRPPTSGRSSPTGGRSTATAPVVVKALLDLARGHPLPIASRSEQGALIRLGQLIRSLEDRRYDLGEARGGASDGRASSGGPRALAARRVSLTSLVSLRPSIRARAQARRRETDGRRERLTRLTHSPEQELRL